MPVVQRVAEMTLKASERSGYGMRTDPACDRIPAGSYEADETAWLDAMVELIEFKGGVAISIMAPGGAA